MRNKGYSKCDETAKFFRDMNLEKKTYRYRSYLDLKKICKCAPRNIMKIRKYSQTNLVVFRLDRGYFEHVHKSNVLDLANVLFGPSYLKHHHKEYIKYNVVILLTDDNGKTYKRFNY